MPLAIDVKPNTNKRVTTTRKHTPISLKWGSLENALQTWDADVRVVPLELKFVDDDGSAITHPYGKGLVCRIDRKERKLVPLGDHPLNLNWEVLLPQEVGFVAGENTEYSMLVGERFYILFARNVGQDAGVFIAMSVVSAKSPIIGTVSFANNSLAPQYALKLARPNFKNEGFVVGLLANPAQDVADYEPLDREADWAGALAKPNAASAFYAELHSFVGGSDPE